MNATATHVALPATHCFGDVSLLEAIEIVDKCCAVFSEVVVEMYPKPSFFSHWSLARSQVLAYQFFDASGLNCAYYLPDLRCLHIMLPGRPWSIPKEALQDISIEIAGTRLHPSPRAAKLLSRHSRSH